MSRFNTSDRATPQSRGQKLANLDAESAESPQKLRKGSTGSNRSNRSNRHVPDSSEDFSSSDSDEMSDDSEPEPDINEEEDDLANIDDVASAMRKRTGANMSFNREWEDVYLADELRMQAHKRDPSKNHDGLPSEFVILLLVVFFATSAGLIAHYLLKFNGYHDHEHQAILDAEL